MNACYPVVALSHDCSLSGSSLPSDSAQSQNKHATRHDAIRHEKRSSRCGGEGVLADKLGRDGHGLLVVDKVAGSSAHIVF